MEKWILEIQEASVYTPPTISSPLPVVKREKKVENRALKKCLKQKQAERDMPLASMSPILAEDLELPQEVGIKKAGFCTSSLRVVPHYPVASNNGIVENDALLSEVTSRVRQILGASGMKAVAVQHAMADLEQMVALLCVKAQREGLEGMELSLAIHEEAEAFSRMLGCSRYYEGAPEDREELLPVAKDVALSQEELDALLGAI